MLTISSDGSWRARRTKQEPMNPAPPVTIIFIQPPLYFRQKEGSAGGADRSNVGRVDPGLFAAQAANAAQSIYAAERSNSSSPRETASVLFSSLNRTWVLEPSSLEYAGARIRVENRESTSACRLTITNTRRRSCGPGLHTGQNSRPCTAVSGIPACPWLRDLSVPRYGRLFRCLFGLGLVLRIGPNRLVQRARSGSCLL